MRRHLKWFGVGLSLVLAIPSLADERCEEACTGFSRKCEETCKKALKKDTAGADRVAACQDKCKALEADCRNDCRAEKK